MGKTLNFKIVKFTDTPNETWDSWLSTMPEASYNQSSFFLTYLHRIVGADKALTFACIAEDGTPIALCPLCMCEREEEGFRFREASWNGAPLGTPVFSSGSPSLKRKIRHEVFEYLHTRFVEEKIVRVLFRVYPLIAEVLSGAYKGGQFELLTEGYNCQPANTIMIDLRCSEAQLLSELSQFQRKHINRAKKKNLRVEGFSDRTPVVTELFYKYKEAHFKSAGRLTRPQESWDWMLTLLHQKKATLFVEFHEATPVSYLYCGEFQKMAFGWSQVNVQEYEKEFSPRHNLEWQAIISYKRNGFLFYEVGTYWNTPQPYYFPTNKEYSISEFKRRYGGLMFGDLVFERIFDRDLFRQLHYARATKYCDLFFSNVSMQEANEDKE